MASENTSDCAYLAAGHDKYRIRSLLLRRPHMQTWLALDEAGDAVVLKKATPGTPEAAQLRREADILRLIKSPHVTALKEVCVDAKSAYLVREYKSGSTCKERLAQSKMSFPETVNMAVMLLHAVRDLHRKGIVHCDLKPANIVLGKKSLTLIDFGMAQFENVEEARFAIEGSVRYMAPEQAGTTKYPVGPRADLFSAGCVIYECLTGNPFYRGETVRDVLREQVEEQSSLRVWDIPSVPRALHEALDRLVQKDPRCRFESVDVALDTFIEIRDRFLSGEVEFSLLRPPPRQAVSEPTFIDRQAELDSLHESIDLLSRGNGGLILLEGESGSGKSRLLQELRWRNCWVAKGQAIDHAAHRPFQVLEKVIEEVLLRAQSDEDFLRRLQMDLAEDLSAIEDAFPRLGQILKPRKTPLQLVGPEALAEQRTLRAGIRLLHLLGDAKHPAVVILDDCQWADDLSLKLLSAWSASSEKVGGYTLVIAAVRSEDLGDNHLLRSAAKLKHISLPPSHLKTCPR